MLLEVYGNLVLSSSIIINILFFCLLYISMSMCIALARSYQFFPSSVEDVMKMTV